MNRQSIIVSGLPRSGASVMMRMLEAGGVDLTFDNIREADDDNPRGYYEERRVRKLKKNSLWLDELNDKAVRIISLLLYVFKNTSKQKKIKYYRERI